MKHPAKSTQYICWIKVTFSRTTAQNFTFLEMFLLVYTLLKYRMVHKASPSSKKCSEILSFTINMNGSKVYIYIHRSNEEIPPHKVIFSLNNVWTWVITPIQNGHVLCQQVTMRETLVSGVLHFSLSWWLKSNQVIKPSLQPFPRKL